MNPIKKLAFLLLVTALAGVCMPPAGQATPPGNKLYTLYPPLNLSVTAVECNAYLHWQKPQMPGGATPAGIVGYYIFRDNSLVKYIGDADTLDYYDYNMEFGTYTYTITAKYDLTSYGLPGQFGESPPAGPAIVVLNCDTPFPFYEPWDQGTFAFNAWHFIPDQSNWTINTGQGNPAPTAAFTGTPSVQNYEVTLRGTKVSGKTYYCANMFLDFDYKLDDVTSGGSEKLLAEYCIDTTWYPVIEISNQGSTGWVHQKIDISQVCGQVFRVGFKVKGQNSSNIGSWQVDNIHAYALCKGPASSGYTQAGNMISLSWDHPPCDSLQFIAGYNVYRTDESGNPPYVKLNGAGIQGFAYTDIIPSSITSGIFRYVITGVQKNWQDDTFLCEAPGDTLLVDYALGIRTEENRGICISPQPANNYLTVDSPSLIESCELFSIVGEKVLTIQGAKKTELTLPVSILPSGIYLVKIKNAAGTLAQKISVIH